MPVSPASQVPLLSPQTRPILTALWLSLGLHGALIALVQLAPPASTPSSLVIEARLETREPDAASDPVPAPAVEAEQPIKPDPVPESEPEPEPVPVVVPEPEPVAETIPKPVPKTVEADLPDTEPVEIAQAPPVARPLPSPPAASVPTAVPPPTTAARESQRSLVEIPAAVDLAYYSAREVDVLPRALGDIRPDYPPEADRRRQSGSVKLQIKLEADGRVSDIEVVEANPPGMFEDSALAAFRQARFSPAQRNGRPVRARVVIEVKYDYEGRLR
jgi:periplasmic protein TonB